MINKPQIYSKVELETILAWWENKFTPQSIFGLEDFGNRDPKEELLAKIFHSPTKTCPYAVDEVKKKFLKLKIKCHPDKYKNTDYQTTATAVFQLLAEAKEYLFFTIDNSHSIATENVFYAYYYLNRAPNETPHGKFENITKQVCERKEQGLDCSYQILAICDLIEATPTLSHHIRDPRHYSSELSNKNIFYLSVQWNEPKLLDWLLARFPEDANVLTPTVFDVSPLDYAVNKGDRIEILHTLQKYFGNEWLKVQLDSYLRSINKGNKRILINYYVELFPSMINNPLMLPALIEKGKISDLDSTRLKNAIIGCPEIYTVLDKSQRLDPYMIVAFLAQQPDEAWLRSIPLRELSPKFAIALADRWPSIKSDVSQALHRDEPPYHNYCAYAEFQQACLAVLMCVSIDLLAWYFWPIITLWPEAVLVLVVNSVLLIAPLCLVIGLMAIASYACNVYPEAVKINTILNKNHFFAPQPEGVNQSEQANQSPVDSCYN